MVHPEIIKVYDQSGLEYQPTAEDRAEAIFEKKATGRPRTTEINAMYRTKIGGFNQREYLWWTETIKSTDFKGNRISRFRIVGKFQKPIPEYGYDENTGAGKATGISEHEIKYETEFSQEKLGELLDKGVITDNTMYYVQTAGRTYGGDILYDDFRDRSFEELVYFGKIGTWPPQELYYNYQQQQGQEQPTEEEQRIIEEDKKAKEKQRVIEAAKKEFALSEEKKASGGKVTSNTPTTRQQQQQQQ